MHLKETVTLKWNQTAQIKIGGSLHTIQFDKLLEESRCQPGTECFWQGQVAVGLLLDETTTDSIGFHTTIPETIPFQNHTLSLVDVSYDQADHYGVEAHCLVKIRVD